MILTSVPLVFLIHAFKFTSAYPVAGVDLSFPAPEIQSLPAFHDSQHETKLALEYARSIETAENSLCHHENYRVLSSTVPSIQIPHPFASTSLLSKSIIDLPSIVEDKVLGLTGGRYPTISPPIGENNPRNTKDGKKILTTEQLHEQEIHPRTHICFPAPPFSYCYTYIPPSNPHSAVSSRSTHLSPPCIFRLPVIMLNMFSRVDKVAGAAIPSATSQGLGEVEGKMGVRSYVVAERILEMASKAFARLGDGGGGRRYDEEKDGEACGGTSWRVALRREWRVFGGGKMD